jgi:hypothetical protein
MPFLKCKVCLPATSKAGARWPRFGLVVVATTSRRDNKDQMIRPLNVSSREGTPSLSFSHISATKMMFWALARVSFRAAKIVSCNKKKKIHSLRSKLPQLFYFSMYTKNPPSIFLNALFKRIA